VPGKRADTVYISTVSFKSGDGFRVSRFSTTLAIRLAQVFSPVAAEGVARDLIAQGYDAHCEEVL
jgi:hypothetical protein